MVPRIDASFLTRPYSTDGGEGLVARFHPDGQLHRLGVYVGGRCLSTELTLEHGVATAYRSDPPGPTGSTGSDSYRNGAVESHDAWSDNSRPTPCDFVEWVRESIARIEKEADALPREPALSRAARLGTIDEVRAALTSAAALEERNAGGRTPLIEAIVRGDDAITRLLLHTGADVNAPEERWDPFCGRPMPVTTPLLAAIGRGDVALIRDLLDRGASPDAAGAGRTPLAVAARRGDLETCRLLLARGAATAQADDQRPTLMFDALAHPDVVALLLAHGVDPEAPWPALDYALRFDAPMATLVALLDAGADPNGTCRGETMLHVAAAHGDTERVALLLARGAAPGAYDDDGRTARDIAAAKGRRDVEALLAAGG